MLSLSLTDDFDAGGASLPASAGIPSYGAALVFELRLASAAGPYVVALRAQDGADETYAAVPLPCARAGSTAETVRLRQGIPLLAGEEQDWNREMADAYATSRSRQGMATLA